MKCSKCVVKFVDEGDSSRLISGTAPRFAGRISEVWDVCSFSQILGRPTECIWWPASMIDLLNVWSVVSHTARLATVYWKLPKRFSIEEYFKDQMSMSKQGLLWRFKSTSDSWLKILASCLQHSYRKNVIFHSSLSPEKKTPAIPKQLAPLLFASLR